MGWLKYLLLGNIGQSLGIADAQERLDAQSKMAREQARVSRDKDLTQDQEIALLRERTERLNLALTALCRFLISKELVGLEELEEFIDQVDVEDSEHDGRLKFDGESEPNSGSRLNFPPI